MKKIILIASIFIVGFANAKSLKINTTETITNAETLNANEEDVIISECQTFNYFSTCGMSATTCQNWTSSQAFHWASLIEENYC